MNILDICCTKTFEEEVWLFQVQKYPQNYPYQSHIYYISQVWMPYLLSSILYLFLFRAPWRIYQYNTGSHLLADEMRWPRFVIIFCFLFSIFRKYHKYTCGRKFQGVSCKLDKFCYSSSTKALKKCFDYYNFPGTTYTIVHTEMFVSAKFQKEKRPFSLCILT